MEHGPKLNELRESHISVLTLLLNFNHAPMGDDHLQSFILRHVGKLRQEDRTLFLNRRDLQIKEFNRRTHDYRPLHFTAALGLPRCAETPLDLGADPKVTTEDGKTALDIATAALARTRGKHSNNENIRPYDRLSSGKCAFVLSFLSLLS